MSVRNQKESSVSWLMRIVQGILIGVGAVLPGISGGVLCVMFGIYQPVMELLSNPKHALKFYAGLLIPVCIGGAAGFFGVSKLLGFFLNRYETQSVCLFVGLIIGMLPSLYREAAEAQKSNKRAFDKKIYRIETRGENENITEGREHVKANVEIRNVWENVITGEWFSFSAAFFSLLVVLLWFRTVNAVITPNRFWYLFCGVCAALSVIVPGLSFSMLLMPLGLYLPFIDGIGNLKMSVLIPAGLGAAATVFGLSRVITELMDRHESVFLYGILGIVLAATLMTVPYGAFRESMSAALVNGGFLVGGIFGGLVLERMNQMEKWEG